MAPWAGTACLLRAAHLARLCVLTNMHVTAHHPRRLPLRRRRRDAHFKPDAEMFPGAAIHGVLLGDLSGAWMHATHNIYV